MQAGGSFFIIHYESSHRKWRLTQTPLQSHGASLTYTAILGVSALQLTKTMKIVHWNISISMARYTRTNFTILCSCTLLSKIKIFVVIEICSNNKKFQAVVNLACGRWTGNYYAICSGLIWEQLSPAVTPLSLVLLLLVYTSLLTKLRTRALQSTYPVRSGRHLRQMLYMPHPLYKVNCWAWVWM